MPEGDTIHNVARRLDGALAGRDLTRFEARVAGRGPRPGTVVAGVEAVGKHLVVRFADGHVLRTHLRMGGRWDLYEPGERWRRPRHLARAVIEVDGAVAVCFSAPVVELTRASPSAPAAGIASLAHLGPDLCRPDADLDAAVARMGTIPEAGTAIADVLLDQRVAAGVGNVYKSEVLWVCRVHPLTPVDDVDGPARRALVERAAELLRRNLTEGPRTTVEGRRGPGPGGRLNVYGRERRPCRRCATAIVRRRTGPQNRLTWWCPRCQPEP